MCAAAIFCTGLALGAALRRRDRQQSRVLHLFRLGLILSFCSYALHTFEPPHSQLFPAFSLLFGLSGTALIWLGFRENAKMQWERTDRDAFSNEEQEELGEQERHPGLPMLTVRAAQVLRYAQEEANRRRQACAGSEHLLLGLLHTPQSEGVRILDRLGVGEEKIRWELGRQMETEIDQHPTAKCPALTEGAQQVFTLAAQEAHRFEKSSVGTEHLLLGLLLMGKGKAASVLLQSGITVAEIHAEIIRTKSLRSIKA